MIALLLQPSLHNTLSCTTCCPAYLQQWAQGLRARRLSPSSWGKASPSTGLRAAGGSCLHPLLSCSCRRATKQQDRGASSTTGASLGCRTSHHVLPLLQTSGSQWFHLGGCGGARAAAELVSVGNVPPPIHRAP